MLGNFHGLNSEEFQMGDVKVKEAEDQRYTTMKAIDFNRDFMEANDSSFLPVKEALKEVEPGKTAERNRTILRQLAKHFQLKRRSVENKQFVNLMLFLLPSISKTHTINKISGTFRNMKKTLERGAGDAVPSCPEGDYLIESLNYDPTVSVSESELISISKSFDSRSEDYMDAYYEVIHRRIPLAHPASFATVPDDGLLTEEPMVKDFPSAQSVVDSFCLDKGDMEAMASDYESILISLDADDKGWTPQLSQTGEDEDEDTWFEDQDPKNKTWVELYSSSL